jgi:MFS transporter, YNFM family, putative membrane transport protein
LILLIGACITLEANLWIKFIGLAIFTFGFFAGHSIASGWVGGLSTHDKAQTSSLYLFFYYVGSSIGGTSGGIFYKDFGWIGVIGMIIVFSIAAVIFSIRLAAITKKLDTN